MSRARERQKRREREAWAWGRRSMHVLRRACPWTAKQCDECHDSGRAADWRELGSHGVVGLSGRYEMCRKCGGSGQVGAGMIHINVTI
jgi:hypothetical protein